MNDTLTKIKNGYYKDDQDGIWALLKLLPKGTYFWKNKTTDIVWIKGDYIRETAFSLISPKPINKYECSEFWDYNRTTLIKGDKLVYISKTF